MKQNETVFWGTAELVEARLNAHDILKFVYKALERRKMAETATYFDDATSDTYDELCIKSLRYARLADIHDIELAKQ